MLKITDKEKSSLEEKQLQGAQEKHQMKTYMNVTIKLL